MREKALGAGVKAELQIYLRTFTRYRDGIDMSFPLSVVGAD